uniref:Uncharacterized protein n=1 Tax=Triticum urartu TaxID=4572 RepID=A0A8R7PFB8_TRIUA
MVVCIGLVAPLSRACLLLPTCTSWKPQAWKPAHCTHSFRLRHEPRKSSQQKTEALARVPADEARLNPSLIAKLQVFHIHPQSCGGVVKM